MSPLSDRAPAPVRFGCSSFSSEDWVGPFYPPGTKPADYLRLYAGRFDTVEIDATYYAIPRVSTVDGWRAKTPPGFLISAKFPRSIVHGGTSAMPDPRRVLVSDATERETARFLEVMSRLGDRLGVLLLQFPYFGKKAFASPAEFLERLDAYLGGLPPEFRYAVEVRNRAWMQPDLAHLLRSHDVSLTLVDQGWMPHGDEMAERFDVVTAHPVYVRLLGDRKEIEAITRTWDAEVVDRRERMQRWVTLLRHLSDRGVPSLVYVNNHYAGHAPTTVRRLMEMYGHADQAEA